MQVCRIISVYRSLIVPSRSCLRKVCEKCSKSKVKLTDSKKKAYRTCDLCMKQRGFNGTVEEEKEMEPQRIRSISRISAELSAESWTYATQDLDKRHLVYGAMLLVSLFCRTFVNVKSIRSLVASEYMNVVFDLLDLGVCLLNNVSSPFGFAFGLFGLILTDEIFNRVHTKTSDAREDHDADEAENDVVVDTGDHLSSMKGFSPEILQEKLKSLTADSEVGSYVVVLRVLSSYD